MLLDKFSFLDYFSGGGSSSPVKKEKKSIPLKTVSDLKTEYKRRMPDYRTALSRPRTQQEKRIIATHYEAKQDQIRNYGQNSRKEQAQISYDRTPVLPEGSLSVNCSSFEEGKNSTFIWKECPPSYKDVFKSFIFKLLGKGKNTYIDSVINGNDIYKDPVIEFRIGMVYEMFFKKFRNYERIDDFLLFFSTIVSAKNDGKTIRIGKFTGDLCIGLVDDCVTVLSNYIINSFIGDGSCQQSFENGCWNKVISNYNYESGKKFTGEEISPLVDGAIALAGLANTANSNRQIVASDKEKLENGSRGDNSFNVEDTITINGVVTNEEDFHRVRDDKGQIKRLREQGISETQNLFRRYFAYQIYEPTFLESEYIDLAGDKVDYNYTYLQVIGALLENLNDNPKDTNSLSILQRFLRVRDEKFMNNREEWSVVSKGTWEAVALLKKVDCFQKEPYKTIVENLLKNKRFWGGVQGDEEKLLNSSRISDFQGYIDGVRNISQTIQYWQDRYEELQSFIARYDLFEKGESIYLKGGYVISGFSGVETTSVQSYLRNHRFDQIKQGYDHIDREELIKTMPRDEVREPMKGFLGGEGYKVLRELWENYPRKEEYLMMHPEAGVLGKKGSKDQEQEGGEENNSQRQAELFLNFVVESMLSEEGDSFSQYIESKLVEKGFFEYFLEVNQQYGEKILNMMEYESGANAYGLRKTFLEEVFGFKVKIEKKEGEEMMGDILDFEDENNPGVHYSFDFRTGDIYCKKNMLLDELEHKILLPDGMGGTGEERVLLCKMPGFGECMEKISVKRLLDGERVDNMNELMLRIRSRISDSMSFNLGSSDAIKTGEQIERTRITNQLLEEMRGLLVINGKEITKEKNAYYYEIMLPIMNSIKNENISIDDLHMLYSFCQLLRNEMGREDKDNEVLNALIHEKKYFNPVEKIGELNIGSSEYLSGKDDGEPVTGIQLLFRELRVLPVGQAGRDREMIDMEKLRNITGGGVVEGGTQLDFSVNGVGEKIIQNYRKYMDDYNKNKRKQQESYQRALKKKGDEDQRTKGEEAEAALDEGLDKLFEVEMDVTVKLG